MPKVLISIDTEPDNQWDPTLKRNPRFDNILELPKVQRLFEKYNAKPTYLVSYSVAKCKEVGVLKNIASTFDCEIGAHLHAWETPPFNRHEKGNGSYLHQYAFKDQLEKMRSLDILLGETFGIKPVSYRGGRYSFDRNARSILEEFGYLVDTSVTPGVSWENDGGPNFKNSPKADYFFDAVNNAPLLEIPVSIRIKSKFTALAHFLYLNTPNWTHAEGILRRLSSFDIIWLDPSFNGFSQMQWVCDNLIKEDARVINIMFHSSVIIRGGSPYTMTESKLNDFFLNLEKLLEYLFVEKKLEGFTLSKYYRYRKPN